MDLLLKAPGYAGMSIATSNGSIVLDEKGEAVISEEIADCFRNNPMFTVEHFAAKSSKKAKEAAPAAPAPVEVSEEVPDADPPADEEVPEDADAEEETAPAAPAALPKIDWGKKGKKKNGPSDKPDGL